MIYPKVMTTATITSATVPSGWITSSSTSLNCIATNGTTTLITSGVSSLSGSKLIIYNGYDYDISSNGFQIEVEKIISGYGIDIQNQKIKAKHGWSIETPDGTLIKIDNNGNIEIEDDNAKIVYKANRIREFNRFLNASDLLEDFIRFIGSKGVKQNEVLNIPIEIFINWLIIEAAKEDGEEPPILPLNNKDYPRCLICGRFIKKSLAQVAKFCNPDHYSKYLLKYNAY